MFFESNIFVNVVLESFWCSFLQTLSRQNRDGPPLVYVSRALAELPPVSVVPSVPEFRCHSVFVMF